MSKVFTQTDTAAPLGVIQACAPVAPAGGADAIEAVSGGTAGTTAQSVAVGSQMSELGFATELRIADDDSLDSGTLVHRLNVSTAQNDLTLEDIYVCRVNSSGTSQETLGSETGLGTDISAGGVFTTNITLSAASAHAAGDRIYITCTVANANQHTSRTLEVLPNQDIDTPFVAASGETVDESVAESPDVEIETGHEVEFTTPGEAVGIGIAITDDVATGETVDETVAESLEADLATVDTIDAVESVAESAAVEETVTSDADADETIAESVSIDPVATDDTGAEETVAESVAVTPASTDNIDAVESAAESVALTDTVTDEVQGGPIEETVSESPTVDVETGHEVEFTTPGEAVGVDVTVTEDVIAPVDETVAESVSVDLDGGLEIEWDAPEEAVGVSEAVTEDVSGTVDETVAESVSIDPATVDNVDAAEELADTIAASETVTEEVEGVTTVDETISETVAASDTDEDTLVAWEEIAALIGVDLAVTDDLAGPATIDETIAESVSIDELWIDAADSDLTDPLTIDGTEVLVAPDGWDYTSENLAPTERTSTGALASGRTDTRGRVRVWTVTTPPLSRADARTLRDDLRTSGTRQVSGYLIGGLTVVRITGVTMTPVEGTDAEVSWTMREAVPVEWGALVP